MNYITLPTRDCYYGPDCTQDDANQLCANMREILSRAGFVHDHTQLQGTRDELEIWVDAEYEALDDGNEIDWFSNGFMPFGNVDIAVYAEMLLAFVNR